MVKWILLVGVLINGEPHQTYFPVENASSCFSAMYAIIETELSKPNENGIITELSCFRVYDDDS